jgi:hypothetical protein
MEDWNYGLVVFYDEIELVKSADGNNVVGLSRRMVSHRRVFIGALMVMCGQ